jgi:hypothetical protein
MATDYKLRISAKDNSKKGFSSVNKNINSTQSAMKKLAGAFAGAFAVRQIINFANETLALADSIGKTADSIGVSTEFLQQYQFAAQQSGIETEQFNKALRFFSKGVGEATMGTGLAKQAFEEMGISLKNSSGETKKSEALFKEFFVSLESIKEPFKRNALLAQVFGAKVGITMANLIKDGSVAMEDLAASATGVIPEDSIRQAEIFNDAMNELKRATLLPLQKAFVSVSTTVLEFLDILNIVDRKKTLGELEGELGRLNSLLEEASENAGQIEIADGVFTNVDIYKQKFRKAALEEEIALIKEQKRLTGVMEGAFKATQLEVFDKKVKETRTVVEQFADTMEGKLTTAFTTFFDFANKEFMNFKNLATSIASAVINELIQVMIVEKMVASIKSGIEGISFSSFLPFDLDNFLSMDGGGFTGSGVRAGGMDGKGGFMAMVHPNETVIDHTKGQGMGGATVNFNISTVDAAGFDQLLASRKGLITSIINQAMNSRGKMGVV